ncbi:hypothetical protein [Pseudomarimonas arenosa]|uniref:Secreted protein n=1 Tax=Pseudomarimonas arenosa TaxID=2774145 RepID=A0AAW3ZRY2_9GAMM|nr:hypothetical protein [Pseudomarimonas arenosa]MBD8527287.1 hypothetical protein [Pseudomarimonas arenosa]
MNRIALSLSLLFLAMPASADADPLPLNPTGNTKPVLVQPTLRVPGAAAFVKPTPPVEVPVPALGPCDGVLGAPTVETVACPAGFAGEQYLTISAYRSVNPDTGQCIIREAVAVAGACTPTATTEQAHCFAPASVPFQNDPGTTVIAVTDEGAVVDTARGLLAIPCPAR